MRGRHASSLKSLSTKLSLRRRAATVGHTNSLAVSASSRASVSAFGASRHAWAHFTGIGTSWSLALGRRTIRDIRTFGASRTSLLGFGALPHRWTLRTSRTLMFNLWTSRGIRSLTADNRSCSLGLGRFRDIGTRRTLGSLKVKRIRLLNIRAARSLWTLLTGSWAIRAFRSGLGTIRNFGASWTIKAGVRALTTSGDIRSFDAPIGTDRGNIWSLVFSVNGASFGALGPLRSSVGDLILVVGFLKEFFIVVALQALDIAFLLGALVSGYFLERVSLESFDSLLLCALEGAGRCVVAVVDNIHIKPPVGRMSATGASRCVTVGRSGSGRSDGCPRGGGGAEGVTERLWCHGGEATIGNAGVNVNLRRLVGKV